MQPGQFGAHRRFVADGGPDGLEHGVQLGLESGQLGRIADAVDLGMNEGFKRQGAVGATVDVNGLARSVAADSQHRMHQQVQGQVVTRQQHGQRVDQERHVVVDDLDDGMGGVPAMTFEIRVVQPHFGNTGLAHTAEIQMGHDGTVQVRCGSTLEIGSLCLFEIGGKDGRHPVGFCGRQGLACNIVDCRNQGGQLMLFVQRHDLLVGCSGLQV